MKEYIPVSVIIPCYSSGDVVERAYCSVCNQTVLPMEVIFVDDGSDDGGYTARLLKKIKHESKILPVNIITQQVNRGAASARNLGWSVAKGEYVAFLDADDVWFPNKLEVQYDIMKKHPFVIMSAHYMTKINEDCWEKRKDLFDLSGGCKLHRLNKFKQIFKHSIPTPTVMVRRNIPHRFQEGKRFSEDFLLWMQLLSFHECILIKKCMAAMFKPPYGVSGLSANIHRMEAGELETLYILYKQNLINPFVFVFGTLFSVFKYLIRFIKVMIIYKMW